MGLTQVNTSSHLGQSYQMGRNKTISKFFMNMDFSSSLVQSVNGWLSLILLAKMVLFSFRIRKFHFEKFAFYTMVDNFQFSV